MEKLQQRYNAQLDRIDLSFVRYTEKTINWDARLNAILGPRGVGKTTLLYQHILLSGQRNESILIFADDIYFSRNTLLDFADRFYKSGGKYLYIDEVHKYSNWSTEIKNIYDQIPDLKIVYTGSSILDIEKGGADLSRRQLKTYMQGLSFREWLWFIKKIDIPQVTFDQVLQGDISFPYKEVRPLPLFKEYLESGYYPFCREENYDERLKAVVDQTLEADIPHYSGLSVGVMRKLKQLMQIISQISPFKPNYSDLARDLSVARGDLKEYLFYMEKAGMIQSLVTEEKGLNRLAKTEKIYLDNTNLMYALCDDIPDKGNTRETFFFNQMRVNHRILSSEVSDFRVGGYTFEVGGRKKGRSQVAGTEKAYIVRDDIEYATPGVVPLWFFGLLY